MAKYLLHITSSDNLGLSFLHDVVEAANMGAVIQEGTLPSLRFPQVASMVLEGDKYPTPKASVRVFDFETRQEIKAVVSPVVPAVFSMEEDEDDNDGVEVPEGVVGLSKEELDALPFDPEFRNECAKVGVKGKKRETMTKAYLAKFAK